MSQGDAERQRDQRAEQEGFPGKLQVLDQTGRDSIGPVPVRGVSEPLPNRLENAHACRVHGNAYRWQLASDTSATKASAIESTVATTSGVWKLSIRP